MKMLETKMLAILVVFCATIHSALAYDDSDIQLMYLLILFPVSLFKCCFLIACIRHCIRVRERNARILMPRPKIRTRRVVVDRQQLCLPQNQDAPATSDVFIAGYPTGTNNLAGSAGSYISPRAGATPGVQEPAHPMPVTGPYMVVIPPPGIVSTGAYPGFASPRSSDAPVPAPPVAAACAQVTGVLQQLPPPYTEVTADVTMGMNPVPSKAGVEPQIHISQDA